MKFATQIVPLLNLLFKQYCQVQLLGRKLPMIQIQSRLQMVTVAQNSEIDSKFHKIF